MTSLLDVPQPFILGKLQLLMTMWTSILTELELEVEDEGDVEGEGAGGLANGENNTNNNSGGASDHTPRMIKRDILLYTASSLQDLEAADGGIPLSPGGMRSRELMLSDPVHSLDTRSFVREKLTRAIEVVGGMEVFRGRWVGDVDEVVLRDFGELGVL